MGKTKTITKKIAKVLLWIIGGLLVLDLLVVGLLFVPPVQNAVVDFVTKKVSKAWQSELSIGHIYITPTLKVVADEVVINDMEHNGMIVVDKVSGRMKKLGFSPFELKFYTIEADGARVVIKKYRGHESVNIAEWARKFKKERKKPSKGFIFQSDKLKLTHSYFLYENEDRRVHQQDSVIDYSFFEMADIDFSSRNFLVNNDDVSANVSKLAFNQYTGFKLLNAAGNFRINSKGLTFDSLALVTPESRIFMDFGFHYATWKTYGSFVDSVIFKCAVRPSVLQLADVAYFVPSIKGMNNLVKVNSIYVDGPVNALKLSDINARYKEKTLLTGDLAIYDITRNDSLRFDADIRNSNLNMRELQSFLLPKGKRIPLPDMVTSLGNVKTDVVYQGTMSDFDTQVLLGTALGEVDAGFTLRKPNDSYTYEGDVRTDGFNLGSFLKKEDLLGQVVMNAKIKGTALPKEQTSDFLSSATATLTGHIVRADVVRYPLKNLKVNAKYAHKKAEGAVTSADTNCLFAFDGLADWQRPSPNFQANLKIDNFAPGNMVRHYPKVDSSRAKGFEKLILYAQQNPSFNLKINSLGLKMHGTDIDNFNGFAQADTLKCRVDDKRFDIQRLRLVAINSERADHQLILTSNVLNASLKTDYSLRLMADVLKSVAYRYFSQLLPEKSEKLKQFERTNNIEEHYLTFNAESYQLWRVLSMFMPNSYVAPNSKVFFQVNPQKHQDSLLVSSRRIILNRKLFFREVEVSGHERADQSFVMHASCDTFSIAGKKNTMDFKNIGIQTDLVDNHLEYNAHWLNPEVISNHTSRLAGDVDFSSRDHIVVRFDPSELYIRDEAWHFEENNALHILNKKIRFDNMSLATNRSHIGVDGTYSDDINDSLTIDIKNLDISILNSYLKQSGMTFGGDVSSKLRLVVMGKSKAYTGRVMISDFMFNEEYFGNVFLLAYLPTQGDVFFTGGISKSDTTVNSSVVESYDYAAFQNESNKAAKLNGYYNPEEKVFKVFAKIDTLHIGFLSPFLASFSNSVRGHASGDLSFIAQPDTFYFDGKVNVQDAYMKIAVLNTDYHLVNQEITFDRQGINFDNILFTDKFNNQGVLKGYVRHHKFKDFQINLDIQTPNLMVLNTPKTSDTPFYGDGFVSGGVTITGDTKTLYFKGKNLQTEKGTVVHLPVSFADRTSESDVIAFKVDPTRMAMEEKKEVAKSSTEMDFDFSFDITPSAVVELDLDLSAFTGTLRANAAGPLQLTYNSKDNLNLYGHAVLSSGSFLMTIKDLITKRFSLQPGGSVIFNGPIENMVLNASAVYSTTASLSDLISAEMTNVSLRRLPVKAYLNLSGKFMENPGIGFSFELPNSTTELSSLFYSAIDTTNNQNMIEQFFSLLMLGKFQANKELAANTTTTTTDLGQSGIGILTSTVSNFLSKQFKNLDINLNYQNADLDHAAEYSVAASTSLFNNRTLIEGNVGYADDKYNSGNSSTFIGDFSIEQKLNEAGTWRVKVFNVTNQYNQLTSTNPYAQGVALIYKQDFNTGKDIAESFKVKKKDKKDKKKKKKESKKVIEDER